MDFFTEEELPKIADGWLRKIMASIFLSAAILAIANLETIWREYLHAEVDYKITRPEKKTKAAIHLKLDKVAGDSIDQGFEASLEQDALNDENPFAKLRDLEPVQRILRKGIAHYHRDTYRSSEYQQESGYDLVVYAIQQKDGSASTILAYLERNKILTVHDVGSADDRVSVVVFVVGEGEGSDYALYRNGDAKEQSKLSLAEAETLINRRISAGVPFFSVAR